MSPKGACDRCASETSDAQVGLLLLLLILLDLHRIDVRCDAEHCVRTSADIVDCRASQNHDSPRLEFNVIVDPDRAHPAVSI